MLIHRPLRAWGLLGFASAAAAFCGFSQAPDIAPRFAYPRGIEGTADVIYGPGDPATPEQWRVWNSRLGAYRNERLRSMDLPSGRYDDPQGTWNDSNFRQYFLFLYDESFFHGGRYQTEAWLQDVERRFGKIDSVVLWQAYPQLGIDSRNQFDFYKQMPGGLAGLREQVSDVLHAHGVHVVLDFNPWDFNPDYEQLGQIVAELDADSVLLDTLDQTPAALRSALERHKPGVVLAPERRPLDEQMRVARSSWAQWYDLGDGRPAIYRQKWLVPQHLQLTIRRWDTDRHDDIVFSFFNGSGLILWDNVFGTWNPYSAKDRRLLAETSVVLHAYADLLSQGAWSPLIPSEVTGLDLNRWVLGSREILLFRNRTDHEVTFQTPAPTNEMQWFTLWSAGDAPSRQVRIPPKGTQALVLDRPERARETRRQLIAAGTAAQLPELAYDPVTPTPVQLNPAMPAPTSPHPNMIALPGGHFVMRISHARRESGCYPWGADTNALWGWFYQDTITHVIHSDVAPFAMSQTAVTNAEFADFVRSTGYKPKDSRRFLEQLPRTSDGEVAAPLSPELAALPVTYVSLEDARAYASWAGVRLPTEAEWQWAASGAGKDNPYPWGTTRPESLPDDALNRTGKLVAANANPGGATPQGIRGLSGNAWEWTDSEWSDGHNRFAMLRGGTFLKPDPHLSEWMLPRGAHRNDYHAKYLLMSPSLDRSESISFRVVAP